MPSHSYWLQRKKNGLTHSQRKAVISASMFAKPEGTQRLTAHLAAVREEAMQPERANRFAIPGIAAEGHRVFAHHDDGAIAVAQLIFDKVLQHLADREEAKVVVHEVTRFAECFISLPPARFVITRSTPIIPNANGSPFLSGCGSTQKTNWRRSINAAYAAPGAALRKPSSAAEA